MSKTILKNNLHDMELETFKQLMSETQKETVEKWQNENFKYLTFGMKFSDINQEPELVKKLGYDINNYKVLYVQGETIKLFFVKTDTTKKKVSKNAIRKSFKKKEEFYKKSYLISKIENAVEFYNTQINKKEKEFQQIRKKLDYAHPYEKQLFNKQMDDLRDKIYDLQETVDNYTCDLNRLESSKSSLEEQMEEQDKEGILDPWAETEMKNKIKKYADSFTVLHSGRNASESKRVVSRNSLISPNGERSLKGEKGSFRSVNKYSRMRRNTRLLNKQWLSSSDKKEVKIDKEFYRDILDYKVYLADGKKIRNEINSDWLVGSGYSLDFIPEKELWIDRVIPEEERNFTIFYEMSYIILSESKIDEDTSDVLAIQLENAIRQYYKLIPKIEEMEKEERKPGSGINKRKIGFVNPHVVYLVDGTYIRNNIDANWSGGNGPADMFIPAGEIWLDQMFDIDELLPYFIHEYIEAELMADGAFIYTDAHELATKIEKISRELWLMNNKKEAAKERFYYDKDLGIPYKAIKQIDFTSKWEVEWPDGKTSAIDIFDQNIKKIKKEEYEKLKKDFLEHEQYMEKTYKELEEIEKEEREEQAKCKSVWLMKEKSSVDSKVRDIEIWRAYDAQKWLGKTHDVAIVEVVKEFGLSKRDVEEIIEQTRTRSNYYDDEKKKIDKQITDLQEKKRKQEDVDKKQKDLDKQKKDLESTAEEKYKGYEIFRIKSDQPTDIEGEYEVYWTVWIDSKEVFSADTKEEAMSWIDEHPVEKVSWLTESDNEIAFEEGDTVELTRTYMGFPEGTECKITGYGYDEDNYYIAIGDDEDEYGPLKSKDLRLVKEASKSITTKIQSIGNRWLQDSVPIIDRKRVREARAADWRVLLTELLKDYVAQDIDEIEVWDKVHGIFPELEKGEFSRMWEALQKQATVCHHERRVCIKCGSVRTCRCSAPKITIKDICEDCRKQAVQNDLDYKVIDRKVDLAISMLADYGDRVDRVMDKLISENGSLSDEEWEAVEIKLQEYVDSLE